MLPSRGTATSLITSAQVIALPTLSVPTSKLILRRNLQCAPGCDFEGSIHLMEVSHLVGIEIFLVQVVGHNEGLKHRLAVAVRRVFQPGKPRTLLRHHHVAW